MKPIMTILLAMTFASSCIFAQSNFGFGAKAGVNVSTQKTTGEGINVDTRSLAGFHMGVYGNYFFLDPVAVQLELLFSQKGSRWSDPYFDGKDRLNYMDVPLLVCYQPLEFLNVHAGPQFGFLMGAKQTTEDGDKTSAKDYYKTTDIGLVIGAEGNLPYHLNITLRYILGLNIVTTDDYYTDGWKNNVFQISVGYRIRYSLAKE